MIPRGAILLAVLIAALPTQAQEPSPADKAFGQLRMQAQGAAPICQSAQDTIAYAGPTDEGLVACLEDHPAATSLRIASLGGPVVPAMEAARIVAARGMDVTVVGFCGSSCGNYVVAAARRLTVLEGSAIMLHGAPLADPAAQREQAVAALTQGGFAEISDALLADAIGQLQRQRALHDRFAADFSVGEEWYDLTDYYLALERSSGPVPQLIVSPAFARACLGHPDIGSYWYPADRAERERLGYRMGSPAMFMGTDLPDPGSCDQ